MLTSLDNLPDVSSPYEWADFVEIRALVHPDRCFSRGDFAALARMAQDTQDKRINVETKWRELIDFVRSRVGMFLDTYPFVVSDDLDTLSLLDDLTDKQKIYIQLLLSANLKYVNVARRYPITSGFEEISYLVFEKLMPEGSEIRAVWARGGDRAAYEGTLFEKMTAIARDIRCKANFEGEDFHERDRGDGGLDIIAWHPMMDERNFIPISFVQCGCSKEDWRYKQIEHSPAKLYRKLPTGHPWATYYFMPQDLRWSANKFAFDFDIGEAIIVDRLRIVRLAERYNIWDRLEVPAFVSEAQELRIH